MHVNKQTTRLLLAWPGHGGTKSPTPKSQSHNRIGSRGVVDFIFLMLPSGPILSYPPSASTHKSKRGAREWSHALCGVGPAGRSSVHAAAVLVCVSKSSHLLEIVHFCFLRVHKIASTSRIEGQWKLRIHDACRAFMQAISVLCVVGWVDGCFDIEDWEFTSDCAVQYTHSFILLSVPSIFLLRVVLTAHCLHFEMSTGTVFQIHHRSALVPMSKSQILLLLQGSV